MSLCQVSNILYLDQPTGTGFSYTSDPRDYRETLNQVADDAYTFLQVYGLR